MGRFTSDRTRQLMDSAALRLAKGAQRPPLPEDGYVATFLHFLSVVVSNEWPIEPCGRAPFSSQNWVNVPRLTVRGDDCGIWQVVPGWPPAVLHQCLRASADRRQDTRRRHHRIRR